MFFVVVSQRRASDSDDAEMENTSVTIKQEPLDDVTVKKEKKKKKKHKRDTEESDLNGSQAEVRHKNKLFSVGGPGCFSFLTVDGLYLHDGVGCMRHPTVLDKSIRRLVRDAIGVRELKIST